MLSTANVEYVMDYDEAWNGWLEDGRRQIVERPFKNSHIHISRLGKPVVIHQHSARHGTEIFKERGVV